MAFKKMEPILTGGKWVVIFLGGPKRFWWDAFTTPEFRHCLAMRYLISLDAWVCVDWGSEGLFIEWLPKEYVDNVIVNVNNAGGRFLEIEALPRYPHLIPPFFPYCVSAIKHLLGLRDPFIITPHQLYCALRKMGARPMFELNTEESADGRNNGLQAEGACAGSRAGADAQG